jgi:hypothetical protein
MRSWHIMTVFIEPLDGIPGGIPHRPDGFDDPAGQPTDEFWLDLAQPTPTRRSSLSLER